MAEKRIAILTLSFSEPRLLAAAFKDGILHIIESKALEPSLRSLQKTLPKRLDKLRKKGFILLVDEVIPNFSRYGRAVRLSDPDGNGIPVIVSAMQAYNNLNQYGAITFPDAGGRYEVPRSIVEEIRGTDGKPVYNIDWPQLEPDHVAVLMAVYAATQDSLFDGSTLTEVMKLVSSNHKPKSPASRFMGMMGRINSEQLSVDALKGGSNE